MRDERGACGNMSQLTACAVFLPDISFDFCKLAWDIGGESSQWWGPMAVAVIFGLLVATLLTLVVVPVLCSLANSLQNRIKR